MNSRLENTVALSSKENDKKGRSLLENVASYEKIKALSHYQSPKGLEAVLHHQQMERRIKLGESGTSSSTMNVSTTSGGTSASHITSHTSGGTGTSVSSTAIAGYGGSYKQTILPKCSYHLTSSTKCGDPVIPLSKFCIKHILEDTSQVLFRTCSYVPIHNSVKSESIDTKDLTESSNNDDFDGN